jgi:hypothetical protein
MCAEARSTSTGRAGSAERDCVRDLARQVAEIAAGADNAAIVKRWRDVNALRRPDRAPVWCRPVAAWDELLPPSALVCKDPWMRSVEYGFRQILCKRDIADDSPVDSFFDVSAAFSVDPPNTWGVDVRRRESGDAGGAWAYDPPLKTEADFGRLRAPRFRYDAAATRRRVERASELLGDILPVRAVAGPPLSATLGTYAADLRGMEPMMLDMADQPALLHRLMGYLRDATLSAMDAVEASGALTPNNGGPMVESDPLAPPPEDGRCTLRHMWCMANSQEFDQVSPAMWEEFCLDYQRPILARFGAVAYGCCENLTRKMDGVLSIPNLRIFVSSAWTDLDGVVARAGAKHTIMWRQKASDVVMPPDVRQVARHLDDGARKLKGCRYQIVLRELQTLAGHRDRLHVWTQLAKGAAARHAG